MVDEIYTKNLEELLNYFDVRKDSLVRFLKNNFKENIHYIKNTPYFNIGKHGGQNKDLYMLKNDVFEIIKDSFNLKHRYLKKLLILII